MDTDPLAAAMGPSAAGRYIGVSRRTLYRLIAEGEVASLTIGSRRLVLRTDLDAYLERRRAEAAS